MATYGSNVAAITYATKDMKSYVTSPAPTVDQTNETEDGTPLGAAVAFEIYTGLTTYGEVTVGGPYDDTATNGPDAVFGGACRNKTTGALIVGWNGSSKQISFPTVGVKNYKRIIEKGGLSKYEATLVVMAATAPTET